MRNAKQWNPVPKGEAERRQDLYIQLLKSGKDMTDAARLAGVSMSAVRKWRERTPGFKEWERRAFLRDQTAERTSDENPDGPWKHALEDAEELIAAARLIESGHEEAVPKADEILDGQYDDDARDPDALAYRLAEIAATFVDAYASEKGVTFNEAWDEFGALYGRGPQTPVEAA